MIGEMTRLIEISYWGMGPWVWVKARGFGWASVWVECMN